MRDASPALQALNAYALKVHPDLAPLKEMPKGLPGRNPVERCLERAFSSAGKLTRVHGFRAVPGPTGLRYWGSDGQLHVGPLPDALQRFIEAYDAGQFPHLHPQEDQHRLLPS